MPRRPDVPCAGECGRLMWRGRGSRPPGEAMCQPCRAVKAKRGICSQCNSTFEAWQEDGKYYRATCSDACAKARIQSGGRIGVAKAASAPRSPRPCTDCSALTNRRGPISLCLGCAQGRRQAHYRRKAAIRRGAAAVGRSLTIEQLGERDGWRCHLCRRRVNPALRAPHPQSRSFDHLVPVSRGGTDAPENLGLAHLRCNLSRGNRGDVQLLLVG